MQEDQASQTTAGYKEAESYRGFNTVCYLRWRVAADFWSLADADRHFQRD